MNSTYSWHQSNYQYLMAEIGRVRKYINIKIESQSSQTNSLPDFPSFNHPEPSTLHTLGLTFDLSPFERDILLLCLAMELDPSFSSLCAAAQGSEELSFPTFALALSALPDAHLSALAPLGALQQWQLLEITPRHTLTLSPLKLDRRIFFYLLGQPGLDEKINRYIRPLSHVSAHPLPPSHQGIADQIINLWNGDDSTLSLPIIQLSSSFIADKYGIAAVVCEHCGFDLYVLHSAFLPTNSSELFYLKRYWQREAILTKSVLLLDCEEISHTIPNRDITLFQFLEGLNLPLIVSSREKLPANRFLVITFDIPHLNHSEQRDLWQTHLGDDGVELNGHLEAIVSQFNLGPAAIQATCHQFKIHNSRFTDEPLENPNSKIQTQLWDFCRAQARPHLEDLSQRIDATATWDDLVLPEQEREILADIAVHLRRRTKVYQEWGFGHKGNRGLGISALFHGASGTGKTMAAEVLANEFRLDLFRIDLSTVVSKYIGETEKNLRRIFDAAETGGAILLFDEADALFAKRTEVKDSHDRYANIEVSYLLQRMEAYQGLAIMTTNLKNSIDKAFERRLRFVVSFPFPDTQARTEIWRRIFPKVTPTDGLDFERLGQLNVAGGNVRNIALNAAFFAADVGEPVMMKHILQAAKREYLKMERSLTGIEVKGWL